jgi:hypothetical protein
VTVSPTEYDDESRVSVVVVVEVTAYAGQPVAGAAWAAGMTMGERARMLPAKVAAATRLAVRLIMDDPRKFGM